MLAQKREVPREGPFVWVLVEYPAIEEHNKFTLRRNIASAQGKPVSHGASTVSAHLCVRLTFAAMPHQVKLKTHTASAGGLRHSVLGRVSGNGKGGRDARRGAGAGESEEWRTSNEGSEGRRGARSRAARDSKQTAGERRCRSVLVPEALLLLGASVSA